MGDKQTIAVYNQNAEKYQSLVKKLPYTQTLKAFISRLDKGAVILDFGCGIGDSAAIMREEGLIPVCIDGSDKMVEIANQFYQLDANVALFSDLVDVSIYDGVWANFSLLHVTKSEFKTHINAIHLALKPQSWFFVGLKLGDGQERDKFGRFYAYYSEEELQILLIQAGFRVDEKIHGKSKGMAGIDEPWLGLICQRIG